MPEGKEFTARELVRLTGGGTQQAASLLIRRHQLAASGTGRGRRFPRETVEAVRKIKDRGRSPQTSNDWLQAVRQLARWLADNGRIDRSPFTRLKPMNASLDQRRRRGELDPGEITQLLAAAQTSKKSFRGLGGADRAMLYRVAMGTGFRAAELAALTPASFDLASSPPSVILAAEFTKNRKASVQPLPAPLAVELRGYLAGRPHGKPVWPGKWHRKAAELLRVDLAAGGIPVEIRGPEGTETRDFHALRAVYISNVIRAGADIKQAMTLARHSDPKLTAGRYARTRLKNLGDVVDRLPENRSPVAGFHKACTDIGGL